MKIDENLFESYKTVMTSKIIKDKVKENYPNVDNIELEKSENSNALKMIY